ncbi:hypothetical protein [Lapidilactobacillus wuchangensis]|uniref:hypothetical protein n=1 Tax=Lapidilactobacillus wuchangensis TaxID=2486001 RepID=UPI000F79D93D|nr:hypothetical protein [Lapidilactobacillus wuchangensis]
MASYVANMKDEQNNIIYPVARYDDLINRPAAPIDTGWVALAITNATGNLWIRRIGSRVIVNGKIHFSKDAIPTSPVNLCTTIPDNMVWHDTNKTGRYSFFSAFSPLTENMARLQLNAATIAILNCTASANDYQIDMEWEVD